MARIQILELPMAHLGNVSQAPFVVIIDNVETEDAKNFDGDVTHTVSELTQDEGDIIASRMGAVSAIVTQCTLEVA